MIPPHLIKARDTSRRASDAVFAAHQEYRAARDAWDEMHRRGVKQAPGVEGDLAYAAAERRCDLAGDAEQRARAISQKASDAYNAQLKAHVKGRSPSARAAYRAALADAQVIYRLARLAAENALEQSE